MTPQPEAEVCCTVKLLTGDDTTTIELDKNCLATMADRLGMKNCDEDTVSSLFLGVMDSLVDLDDPPRYTDEKAFLLGQKMGSRNLT